MLNSKIVLITIEKKTSIRMSLRIKKRLAHLKPECSEQMKFKICSILTKVDNLIRLLVKLVRGR